MKVVPIRKPEIVAEADIHATLTDDNRWHSHIEHTTGKKPDEVMLGMSLAWMNKEFPEMMAYYHLMMTRIIEDGWRAWLIRRLL